MAFINIAEWSPENVAEWLKGLDDCILPYVQFFLNNNINGCRLLLLSSDDLNNLNVTKVGHQEIVLEAVDLLKQLHYNLGSETLQSLALRLGCRSRSLFNQLRQDDLKEEAGKLERVSSATLSSVSEILVAVKSFISWIDRYPFEGQDQYIPVRKTILRLSIELASTAQRDQFVDKPNDVIKISCMTLAELCDRIVQELSDSLAIQPANLDIVTVKKKTDEELGMHIHSSYSGIHIVGGIKFQSPSHRCGRIEEGDEIIQVNYQTVVGWQLKKLVSTMREQPMEIVLTLKKRPRHSNIMGQVNVLRPYKIPPKKVFHNRNHNTLSNKLSKNAATTTAESDDDEAFMNDVKHSKQPKGPVYHLNKRPKLCVRRRATISGASPTSNQPPIRIEDLVVDVRNKCKQNKKELIERSISHDSGNSNVNANANLSPNQANKSLSTQASPDVPSPQNASQVPFVVPNHNKPNVPASVSSTAPSPKLPYAKVHPIPIEISQLHQYQHQHHHSSYNYPNQQQQQHCLKQSQETTPKRIASKSEKVVLTSDKKEISSSIGDCNDNEDAVYLEKLAAQQKQLQDENANVGIVNAKARNDHDQSVNVLSYQLVRDIHGNSNSNIVKDANENIQSFNKNTRETVNINEAQQTGRVESGIKPALRPRNTKGRSKHASRRISRKDLGEGDCHGWLFQRREQRGLLSPSYRWIKRWVVLTNNYLYCYKDCSEENEKAECLIHLPGFTVSPTVCKSKKHAFKLHNPNTVFYFASESQNDMSKWMNNMGLAAISYMSQSDLQPEAFCYSESEGSEEGSPAINSNRNNQRLMQQHQHQQQYQHQQNSPYSNTTPSNTMMYHPYRQGSPGSGSTSSSDNRDIYETSPLSSTSSTTSSSSFHETYKLPDKPSYPTAPKPKPVKATALLSKQHHHQHQHPTPPHHPQRINYVRSSSCLDASDVMAAKSRMRQLSIDAQSPTTRYAKIVFPSPTPSQELSPSLSSFKACSSSPQIPPRGPKISLSSNLLGLNDGSSSLDRQQVRQQQAKNQTAHINLATENAAGNNVSKVTGSCSLTSDSTPKSIRPVEPPRPQPRISKLANNREKVATTEQKVFPGYVASITDSFDKLAVKPTGSTLTASASTVTTPSTVHQDAVANEKTSASKTKEQDETYEYVFRPTMAMIKTGIVNPLYDRVHNRSWSGSGGGGGGYNSLPRGRAQAQAMPGSSHIAGSTGKRPMPLPHEINHMQHQYAVAVHDQQQASLNRSLASSSDGLSLLDQEYKKLFGDKKPTSECISPNASLKLSNTSPLSNNTRFPMSSMITTSPEMDLQHAIYASKVNKLTESLRSSEDSSTDKQLASPSATSSEKSSNDRPQTPSSSDNSLASSSGISSYYSTYLEIPAEQMQKMMNISQATSSIVGSPSYHSAKSSPNQTPNECLNKSNASSISSPMQFELQSNMVSTSTSPTSSNSNKLNKSPTKSSSFRFFSSPKLLKKLSTPKYQKERHLEKKDVIKVVAEEKSTKSSLFLGSPKLTRAIFGSGKKHSHHHDGLNKSLSPPFSGISEGCQTDESFVRNCSLNRSSSDSSVTSNPPIIHHHHIVEAKINKPQLTITLPFLAESGNGTDSSSGLPQTPDTPRKPTMGIAMIGKRRISNVSSDKSSIETALHHHAGGSLSSSRTGYNTEDTDEEWANIAKTIEQTGRTLAAEKREQQRIKNSRPIDDEQLCHLVLSLRGVQRSLKPERIREIEAIDELLNQAITLDVLEEWIKKYPNLLPREYFSSSNR